MCLRDIFLPLSLGRRDNGEVGKQDACMEKLGKEGGVGKTHLQVFRVLPVGRWGKPMCGNFVMPSKNEGSILYRHWLSISPQRYWPSALTAGWPVAAYTALGRSVLPEGGYRTRWSRSMLMLHCFSFFFPSGFPFPFHPLRCRRISWNPLSDH